MKYPICSIGSVYQDSSAGLQDNFLAAQLSLCFSRSVNSKKNETHELTLDYCPISYYTI